MGVLRMWTRTELNLFVGTFKRNIEPCEERMNVCAQEFSVIFRSQNQNSLTVIAGGSQGERDFESQVFLLDS